MAGGLTMTNQREEVPMSLDKPEALRTPRLERATQSGVRGSGLRSVTLDAFTFDAAAQAAIAAAAPAPADTTGTSMGATTTTTQSASADTAIGH